MVHFLDMLAAVVLALCAVVNLDMYRHLRSRSFLWIALGLTCGALLGLWQTMSEIGNWASPRDYLGGPMLAAAACLGLLLGFCGFRQALKKALDGYWWRTKNCPGKGRRDG